MITANVAAAKSAEYFHSMTGIHGMLEEVESVEEGGKKFWLITLGFAPLAPASPFFVAPHVKEYKEFKVDAEDGNVLSMKIRTIR